MLLTPVVHVKILNVLNHFYAGLFVVAYPGAGSVVNERHVQGKWDGGDGDWLPCSPFLSGHKLEVATAVTRNSQAGFCNNCLRFKYNYK